VSSSAGGRVCGVTSSRAPPSHIVNASRTTTHPDGVFHVVSSTFVPGSYWRADGTLMPNGPNRNIPASRSSRLPNTLGESNRGTHNQSTEPSAATNAPVWQFDKNANSAIGGNGDGDAALACPAREPVAAASVGDLRVAMGTSGWVFGDAVRPSPSP
jgi:hypothetical protein